MLSISSTLTFCILLGLSTTAFGYNRYQRRNSYNRFAGNQRTGDYGATFNLDHQEPFFVGNWFSNASSEPESNMWATYIALGIPSWVVGQSLEIDITTAGRDGLYHLLETVIPANMLIQDIYFKLNQENSTVLPGNLPTKFVVRAPNSKTLLLNYFETTTYRVVNTTIDFDQGNTGFTTADLSYINGGTATAGKRHYTKRIRNQ